jgi:hypothetical protein
MNEICRSLYERSQPEWPATDYKGLTGKLAGIIDAIFLDCLNLQTALWIPAANKMYDT